MSARREEERRRLLAVVKARAEHEEDAGQRHEEHEHGREAHRGLLVGLDVRQISGNEGETAVRDVRGDCSGCHC